MLVMMWGAIAYLVFGHHISGYFGHSVFTARYIVSILYTDLDSGAYGFLTEVSLRVVSIFMVFAALLMASGLGELFTALAAWLAGDKIGGPAKVAVISSGAFGMLSGSPVANVAATGSFTIPLMKSLGYKPSTAATIEALASTGGNLMPPIMGIAAFIMADILGLPYLRVCLAAIIPVFFWYFVCFYTVHFYALRSKLRRWRPAREEIMPVVKQKIHLLAAVPILVGAMFYFASAETGAFWAVVALFILTCIRKETRLNKSKVAAFLYGYARMYAPLRMLMIALAIFIGAFTGSGVHIKLGMVIFGSIEQWYVVLLLAALVITLLGMAVPITAAYLACVAVLVPILAAMGYVPLLIHMFVLYMATLAPITPPVCFASFTAARIAGSDLMKTGLEASFRGLPLWIVPFAVFRQGLLLGIGTPSSALAIGVGILVLGVFIFILGAEGYFCRELKSYERILAIIIGLMIAQPISDFCSWVFSGCGVLLITYWLISHRFEKSRLMHD